MSRRANREFSPPITLFSFQDIMAAVTGVMILVTLLLAIEPLTDELLREERRAAPDAPTPTQQAPQPPIARDSTPAETPTTVVMAIELAEQLVRELEAEIARRRATPVVDEETLAAMEAQLAQLQTLERESAERLTRVMAALASAQSERDAAERADAAAAEALAEAEHRLERETRRSRVRFLPGERYEKAPLFIEVRADRIALGGFDETGLLTMLDDTSSTSGSALDSRGAVSPAALTRLLGSHTPQAHQLVFIVRQDALAPFALLRDDAHARGWEVGWQLWDAKEGGFFAAPVHAPSPSPATAPPNTPPAVPRVLAPGPGQPATATNGPAGGRAP